MIGRKSFLVALVAIEYLETPDLSNKFNWTWISTELYTRYRLDVSESLVRSTLEQVCFVRLWLKDNPDMDPENMSNGEIWDMEKHVLRHYSEVEGGIGCRICRAIGEYKKKNRNEDVIHLTFPRR